jgi:hypothetical protein
LPVVWWSIEIEGHELRKLPIPEFDVGVAIDSCVAQIKDVKFANRLAATKPTMLAAQATYLAKGAAGILFSIPAAIGIDGVVSVEDMTRLYSGQFFPKPRLPAACMTRSWRRPNFQIVRYVVNAPFQPLIIPLPKPSTRHSRLPPQTCSLLARIATKQSLPRNQIVRLSKLCIHTLMTSKV